MAEFADVIIDITHEKVDRPFQYRIPRRLQDRLTVGCQVEVPFGMGNHIRRGFVVGVSDRAEYAIEKIKEIAGILEGSVSAESQLIQVAWWMKERYGSTMNQALKTVLPVKQQVKPQKKQWVFCLVDREELWKLIQEAAKKKYRARERLLRAFLETNGIPFGLLANQMNISRATIKPLEDKGILMVDSRPLARNPAESYIHKSEAAKEAGRLVLNPQQQQVVSRIKKEYGEGIRKTYLIHGITGSGKTEIYMELIDYVRSLDKQVILLIPEIALTYQTVMRFCRRFGNQVSFINSRLSAGERYEQFERAKKGEIPIMIGPRSALFTPFRNLGMIIIDEEHEGAYKSEITPRYHAREAALYRASLSGASVVLGSATPSLESYVKAMHGIYGYFKINQRAKKDSVLPRVQVVDMRRELQEGNRSIFSRSLAAMIEERLAKREQVMLFLNRRGYSRFLSCRNCGEAIKCPHCDVTLTLHREMGQENQLVCHYCGYHIPRPKTCPSCGSPYLAPFGTGTQKVEAMVREVFPQARVLRMDLDTTAKKGGHEEIIAAFGAQEADILIGTQMIVKGHDFPAVTLVGILAADLSLYASDYQCSERTFQLLTQAAGRAGRDERQGDVIIQTYSPKHYCIEAAAAQDYEAFCKRELEYRKLLHYPPVCVMMTLLIGSEDEALAETAMGKASRLIRTWEESLGADGNRDRNGERNKQLQVIGPVNAPVYKLNDIYRKIIYMKSENYAILIQIRTRTEEMLKTMDKAGQMNIQFDFC